MASMERRKPAINHCQKVLGREEASNGVCCSWLARAGLGEHSLSAADKGRRVQGEKPTGVTGTGLSPRSPSEVACGLCQGCVSSLAVVSARGCGAEGDGDREGDVGWGGVRGARGEMCSWRCRRKEMGSEGHEGGI